MHACERQCLREAPWPHDPQHCMIGKRDYASMRLYMSCSALHLSRARLGQRAGGTVPTVNQH